MTNAIPNFELKHNIQMGYKDVTAVGGSSRDLTKYLYNLPTLNVSGSTANNGAVTVSFANIFCVNFIGGVRVATIQSATLAVPSPYPATYIFANTGGTFPVSIKLDNGGTVGGLGIYPLNSGTIIQLSFDGTNLN